jgi:hypothetical protein
VFRRCEFESRTPEAVITTTAFPVKPILDNSQLSAPCSNARFTGRAGTTVEIACL